MCVCVGACLPVREHAQMLLKPVYRPEEEELGAYLDPFLLVTLFLVTLERTVFWLH